MAEAIADIATSPAMYPQKVDLARNIVLMLHMNEADYRNASFLDDRILTPASNVSWQRMADVAAAMSARSAAVPLQFIFHTGHVGSTLLSRLLEAAGGVLSLREPVPLRTFAQAYDAQMPGLDDRLETLLRLWERGFADTKTVVVKATSSASRMGPVLLEARPASRAVYLNVDAETYIATALAGENSIADLEWHRPERLKRLQSYLPDHRAWPPVYTHGQLAAIGWLAETLTQQRLVHRHRARVLPLDFERLLADMAGTVQSAAEFLGIALPRGEADAIAQGPVATRYSKAPEHAYSAQLRRALLEQARRDHAVEFKRGLLLLDEIADRNADVAGLLRV